MLYVELFLEKSWKDIVSGGGVAGRNSTGRSSIRWYYMFRDSEFVEAGYVICQSRLLMQVH